MSRGLRHQSKHTKGRITVSTLLGVAVTALMFGLPHQATAAVPDNAASPPSNVFAWGFNFFGQFGNGTFTGSNVPVPGPAGTYWTEVSTGAYHSCGIRTDSTLWCWGKNYRGALGDGTNMDSSVPVQEDLGANDWAQVSAGTDYTCAIRRTGTLWCWGGNVIGQLGHGTYGETNVPVQVGTETTWAQVSVGGGHSCAVRTNGTLWCWGANVSGQLGIGSTVEKYVPAPAQEHSRSTAWVQVAVGGQHTCAVTAHGTVWCWGSNYFGQLGNGTTIDRSVPVQARIAFVTHVAAGNDHSCAVRKDGTLRCWGSNFSGELGDGTNIHRRVPVQEATKSTHWTRVTAGLGYSCGLRLQTLWCWGSNHFGQLGNGTNIDSNVPVQEATQSTDWIRLGSLSSGSWHTMALKMPLTLPLIDPRS
jgi:alpha-tubulin suppressor-like RCC1 family protein